MLKPEFVLAFREAAPYINMFRGKTFVVALSGEGLERGNVHAIAQDLNLLVSLGVRIVLVHGARPQIDAALALRGLPRAFHQEIRITDAAALEAVKHAVGALRLDIEAHLSMSMANSPMQGAQLRVASGNWITARPRGVLDGVDMHYSGSVRKVDADAIAAHLARGELALLSPLGYSPTGEAFNLTMEEVALATAVTLRAEKLIFLVEAGGLIDAAGVFHNALSARDAEAILAAGVSSTELSTALPCAIRATREGVTRSHLVSWREDGGLLLELFTNGGTGTMIARDDLVRVRPASIDDIGDILALIAPLEEKGILVRRSRERLEMEIGNFLLLEHDDRVHGCVAMHPFPNASMAELACLAVAQDRQDAGFGEILLRHVEARARARGLTRLFVLTTQTAHWFVERGFVSADIDALPVERQACYNNQRRSKVFVKTLPAE